MDEFYDFNALKQSLEVYGGASCAKFAVKIGSDEYLIKFPANLKNKTFKNKPELTYSNGPFSEYIGSHIYGALGFPVHQTILGKRDNHVVVACRNFLNKERGERLFEAKLILKNVNPSPDTYES